jgi:hypothetical protein
MGKQILFHMLPRDCEEFLAFLQRHDPVVITARDSDSREIQDLSASACSFDQTLSLWNQPLLPQLERKRVRPSRPYYTVDNSLPVLEMTTCHQCDWDRRAALTQGRVWGSFEEKSKSLDSWFEAISRWIRSNYVPNHLTQLRGYIAPGALEWHKQGGILLPMLVPPVKPEWRKFVASQHDRTGAV